MILICYLLEPNNPLVYLGLDLPSCTNLDPVTVMTWTTGAADSGSISPTKCEILGSGGDYCADLEAGNPIAIAPKTEFVVHLGKTVTFGKASFTTN